MKRKKKKIIPLSTYFDGFLNSVFALFGNWKSSECSSSVSSVLRSRLKISKDINTDNKYKETCQRFNTGNKLDMKW